MSKISRRQFVTQAGLATAGVMVFSQFGVACGRASASGFVEGRTAYGKVKGIREEGVNIFRGIPYAGKVSGERRFRTPAPLEPWTGIREALSLGHPSIQPPNQTYGINEPEPAEDCLVLNVWTPANDNGKRPVMFYNHGGGFGAGSGGAVSQDGANLARNFNVVVVQTNHRLGMMGYLYLKELGGEEYASSGDNGMLDIVEGLKWVHENIAEFGGDPDNVMVFGESGGGAKTSCIYAMPSAAPYFHKASIESGPGIRVTEPEVAAETTLLLLKALEIDPANWRQLLEVPVERLLEMQMKLPKLAMEMSAGVSKGIAASKIGGFSPVRDSVFMPNHPFDPVAPEISREKPLMVGWNEDEQTFFGMMGGDTEGFNLDEAGLKARLEQKYGKDAQRIFETYRKTRPEASPSNIYVEIMSVSFAGNGSTCIAEKKFEQKGAPVYLYNFGYKSETKIPGTDYEMGTPHAMDIMFKFNNVVPAKDGAEEDDSSWAGKRPERFAASHNMAALWTSFARDGKPSAEGQPEWPSYSIPERPLMRIDSQCEVIYDRNREEREMWTELGYI